ncbi:MAG: tetratricopeptide repeat protein [Methyloligellaceae bacterium]
MPGRPARRARSLVAVVFGSLCLALPLAGEAAAADDWRACLSSDSDQAIAGCTRVIGARRVRRSNLSAAHYNRGLAYRDKRIYDKAIADFSESIRIDPKNAKAHYQRGNIHADLGDSLDLAIADYDLAIRIDPRFVFAYNARGLAHEAKGDLARAAADYRSALELDPSLSLIRQRLEGLEAGG